MVYRYARILAGTLAITGTLGVIVIGCSGAQRRPSSDADAGESVEAMVRVQLREQYILNKINDLYGKHWQTIEQVVTESRKFPADERYGKLQKLLSEWRSADRENEPLLAHLKSGAFSILDELKSNLLPTRFAPTVNLTPAELRENEAYPIRAQDTLRIEDPDEFKLDGSGPKVLYGIENHEYTYALKLENRVALTAKQQKTAKGQDYALSVKYSCSEPVTVKRTMGKDFHDTSHEFVLYHQDLNTQETEIEFPSSDVSCEVYFKPEHAKEYQYGLKVASRPTLPKDKIIGKVRETCLYDPQSKPSNPTELFRNIHYSPLSCEEPVDEGKLMTDPMEALSEKLYRLTGKRYDPALLAKHDPDMELDFSNAPKLDLVIATTIEYKYDFTGKMIGTALKWHADHGAIVRILVTGIKQNLFDKEKNYLRTLERQNRNIRVQFYLYGREDDGAMDRLNRLQRCLHAKLLIGVSDSDPGANFVITGGRNIKDLYYFKDLPTYPNHPEMNQYGPTGEGGIYYQDLEVLLRGEKSAKQVAAQAMSFFYRDSKLMNVRPASIHLPVIEDKVLDQTRYGTDAADPIMVRHIVSLPFVDNRQLEEVFADMFNSATKTIMVTSPYFRPTEKIAKALLGALKRGVKITFTTRIDLAGDNNPPISSDVNKESVNKYYQLMDIYSWTEPKSILHVKAVLIDDDLLFIGGTNLNNRTFYHDVESGFMIKSAELGRQFKEIYKTVYIPNSDHIETKQKMTAAGKLLIPIVGGFF